MQPSAMQMLRWWLGSDLPRLLALADSQNILGTLMIESCNNYNIYLDYVVHRANVLMKYLSR